jgi:filamentous hemagglutinin family protein
MTRVVAEPAANAQPTGGKVVAGVASIGQTASRTAVTQSSQRAAIDWSSFDVGSKQTVVFQQPSTTAVTLNRVTGPDPSRIAGRIQANGQIVVTNQSGVVFTKGAQVDTAGLIVSAAGISNRDFMAGRMAFDQSARPGASVVNQGTITVRQAGLATLVAPQVANSGVINARLGHVILAGAKAVTLDLYGDGLVSLDVTRQAVEVPVGTDGKRVSALVTNTGAIVAAGGTVQLTAAAVDGLVTNLVTAGGQISAVTAHGRSGAIVVEAAGGSATVTGTLTAEGRSPGTAGGRVQVSATDAVNLFAGARISVAGKAGGGTVGLGTATAPLRTNGVAAASTASGRAPLAGSARVAKTVTVQSGATVVADATAMGDGGRVVVVSTERTRVDGRISAKGGSGGGNGGFVEVSGKALGISGQIDASAMGAPGTILLDPDRLTIVAGTAGAGAQDPTFAINGGTVAIGTPSTGSDTITNGVINAFAGNVLLQAGRELTVDGNIALTGGSGQRLTLEAGGTVTVGTGVTVAAPGGVVIATGGAGPSTPPAGQAAPLIAILGSVASTNGSVSLLSGAGGTITIGTAGSIAAAPGQRLTLQSDALTVRSGSGSLRASEGIVEIAPASALAVHLAGVGGLAVARAALHAVDASVLRIGAATIDGRLATTAGAILVDAGVTMSLPVATIDLRTTGAVRVGDAGSLSNVGTLIGRSASFDATNGVNRIAVVGNYVTTGDFALQTAADIAVAGTLSGADVTVRAGGISRIAVTGSIAASGTVALAAGRAGLVIQGGALLDAEAVDLSSGGGLSEAPGASITAGTLRSSAGVAGAVDLAGAANAIGALGDMPVNAGAFHLVDTGDLALAGALAADAVNIFDAGRLLVSGRVMPAGGASAIQVGLTADAIAIPGTLSDGGAGSTSLIARTGSLSETGVLRAGTLSGRAATGIDLTGARPTANTVTALGPITAGGGLALSTAGRLDVVGTVGVGPGRTIALRADSLALHATLAAPGGQVAIAPATAGRTISLDTVRRSDTLSLAQGDIDLIHTGTLTLGSVDGVDSVAGAIRVNGTAIVGAETASLLQLDATGDITGAGVLGTPRLRGQAAAVALTGVNAIHEVGDFTAPGGFGLQDAVPLTISGLVAGGPHADIASRSSLSVPGTVTAAAVNLTGSSLDLSGGINGGVVTLIATQGGIAASGVIAAALLEGSAATGVGLLGANRVAILGDFTAASGFVLNQVSDLAVNGAVFGGNRIALTTSGALSIQGSVTAASIALDANGIALGGAINGSDDVSLVSAADIGGGGVLRTDLLTGAAAGSVTLVGPNAISRLGDFSAGAGFTLVNLPDLAVIGGVGGGPGVTITDAGTLAIPGRLDAANLDLTARAIDVAGQLSGTERVGLTATTGGIVESGSIATSLLIGKVATDAALFGTNRISVLGDFTAGGGIALNDTANLSVIGTVNAGGAVVLTDEGGVSIPGGLRGRSVALTAASIDVGGELTGDSLALRALAGGIGGSGIVDTAQLTGSAAQAVVLSGPNRVTNLADFRAGAGFTLNNLPDLTIRGIIDGGSSVAITNAGSIAAAAASITGSNRLELVSTAGGISEMAATLYGERLVLAAASGHDITLFGGTLLTGGAVPVGRIGSGFNALPVNGGAGALLAAHSIRQLGTLAIANPTGNNPAAQLAVSGDIALETVAAPRTWLILTLQNGSATALDLSLRRLDLSYAGSGGGAALFGTIGGLSGSAAAQSSFVLPQPNASYLLNGCPIGSVNCVVVQRDPVPVQKLLETADFAPARTPTDDPEFLQIMPNIARRDY